MMKHGFLSLSLALIGLTSHSALAQNYNFALVECNNLVTMPTAINASGTIVGSAYPFDAQVSGGFIYANGTCTSTNFMGFGADFLGITNSGEIIDYARGDRNYLLSKGSSAQLPNFPGASATYYVAKNTAGVFVGNYSPTPTTQLVGFVYQNGTFTSLPYNLQTPVITGLNDNGVIVGTFNGYVISGFVYQNDQVTYLEYPGANYTQFGGINNQNIVVGRYSKNTGEDGVFSYDLRSGTWTNLSFPQEYKTVSPVGISDSGVIVALYSPSGGMLIATPQ